MGGCLAAACSTDEQTHPQRAWSIKALKWIIHQYIVDVCYEGEPRRRTYQGVTTATFTYLLSRINDTSIKLSTGKIGTNTVIHEGVPPFVFTHVGLASNNNKKAQRTRGEKNL